MTYNSKMRKLRHSKKLNLNEVTHLDRSCSRKSTYKSSFESQWWPWMVAIVTAVVRIRYVTLTENLWILHPDEIFQSVEVAFSEIYGYGFRPYEYLPAPINVNISAERQMLTSGMYGLRSPLYPRMFMAVLSIAKVIGLDENPFMVCRIFNAFVTSLLPLTVYWFIMKLFQCRLLAFLTCALSAMERHLVVIGTHTVVNSFISPFIFCGLAMVIPSEDRIKNANICVNEDFDNSQNMAQASDQNGNLINSLENVNTKHKVCHMAGRRGLPRKKERLYTYISCFLTRVTETSITATKIWTAAGGFLLAAACYVRPDSVLFCIATISAFICANPTSLARNLGHVILALPGGAVAMAMCVADDFSWYGNGVISPLQWFIFNVYSGKSHQIFGYKNPRVYLNIFMGNYADILVTLCLFLALIYRKIRCPEFILKFRLFCAVFCTFVLVMLFYSVLGHKEVRFVHNGIVLFTSLIAYSLYIILCAIFRIVKSHKIMDAILICLLTSYAYYSHTNLLSADDTTIPRWTHGKAQVSRDVNACFDWLRHQDDVTGVLIDASLYDTAGLVLLKHNVPIAVQIHNEYFVYDLRNETSNRNIRAILNFTDLFHSGNEAYRIKLLSKDTTYNYIISNRTKVSLINSNFSYDRIYSYRHFHVFRRNFSSVEENMLHAASIHVPFGLNSTELEYEANWLITNARYERALERVYEALKLNQSRVRLHQQMFVCYAKLNQWKLLHVAQENCFQRFGKDACLQQQPKVTLYDEYENIP